MYRIVPNSYRVRIEVTDFDHRVSHTSTIGWKGGCKSSYTNGINH
ncbi:MAG: hypothetical protein WBO36_06895 [Saprospiraceae bacterium]